MGNIIGKMKKKWVSKDTRVYDYREIEEKMGNIIGNWWEYLVYYRKIDLKCYIW